MLINHVRNKHGQKIGTLVALSKEEIGWSRCHTNLDRFDKQVGIDIAKQRAIKYDLMTNAFRCADSLKLDFIKMVRRADKYFKDNDYYGEPKNIPSVPYRWESIG